MALTETPISAPGLRGAQPPRVAPSLPGFRTLIAWKRDVIDTQRPGYLPQIDGLRGLAVLLVLVWHASLRASRFAQNVPGATSWYDWFPHGEIGVCLFFFISGFVLASPFARKGVGDMRLGTFYRRRFMRIYPPYAVALVACLGMVMASGYRFTAQMGGHPIASFFASLFYMNSLIFDFPSLLNPPMWSLEVEAQFYLLAPFLMRLFFGHLQGSSRMVWGMVAIAAALGALGLVQVGLPVEGRFRLGLIAHFHLFLGGIVAAELHNRYGAQLMKSRSRAFDVLFALGLVEHVTLGLWMTQIDAKPRGGAEMVIASLMLLTATASLFFGGLYGKWATRLLSSVWLRLAGMMCFSIYLVHVPILQGFATMVMPRLGLQSTASIYAAAIISGGALSLALSLVFHLTVERPSMQARKD